MELIREKPYLPQIDDDVKYYVSKICKLIKDKRPVRLSRSNHWICSIKNAVFRKFCNTHRKTSVVESPF